MDKISIVTYTNKNCHDVLRVHLGQITKFAPNFKSFVFTNEMPEFEVGSHNVVLYNNDDPYYKQFTECLEEVETDYIIYMQEDFLMSDDPNLREVERCLKFLEETNYSFTRLVRLELSGHGHFKNCQKKSFEEIEIQPKIYDAHISDPDSFAFMMQTTLWKKKDFVDLYTHVKSQKWLESESWESGMRDLDLQGSYYYDCSPKEAKYHWQPEVWPHICTAVGKGKWNLSFHGARLLSILENYKIDMSKRGTR